MRVPDNLVPLLEDGIIDQVIRPLLAGKEAQIFLVESEGEERVAKVYKKASERSFKHRADYTEGRRVRNSRDQRAMAKRSNYGRQQDEAAWRSTEVDIIYRLRAAGVRVPVPYHFVDGVLVMELVKDGRGQPAPRLADVFLSKERSEEVFEHLLDEIVRMLHAGVVHGDLSEFNILMDNNGPVIIDFPQALDPSKNQNARRILLRDIENIKRFLGRKVSHRRRLPYGQELWDIYERGELTPHTKLQGQYSPKETQAGAARSVLEEIEALEAETRQKRQALGIAPKKDETAIRIEITPEEIERSRAAQKKKRSKRKRRGGAPGETGGENRKGGGSEKAASGNGERKKPVRKPKPRPMQQASTDGGGRPGGESKRPQRRRRYRGAR